MFIQGSGYWVVICLFDLFMRMLSGFFFSLFLSFFFPSRGLCDLFELLCFYLHLGPV